MKTTKLPGGRQQRICKTNLKDPKKMERQAEETKEKQSKPEPEKIWESR
jgi:hypothetical protein